MPSGGNGISTFGMKAAPISLSIKQVLGTSAGSSREFCVRDNVIAYTASGGVVECSVDLETEKITSQRFFCANGERSNCQPAHSGANAYLNMALGELEERVEAQRDTFGFFKNTDPMEVTGASSQEAIKSIKSLAGGDGESSPSKSKERVRSVSCLDISPDGRLVAIGETGYQPRVLLFSLAPDSSNRPIAQISEHSFGVHSLAFSPDSRYLCSLGTINDGFIHIWRISPTSISLVCSNKCTSVINSLIWQGKFIVTAGLRLIKVWRLEEENTKSARKTALKGKNVLLGSMMNSNFKSLHVLSDDEVMTITNTHHVLLLKINYDDLKFSIMEIPFDFPLNLAVDNDEKCIWVASDEKIEKLPFDNLKAKEEELPSLKHSGVLYSPGKSVEQDDSILKVVNLNAKSLLLLSNCESLILFNKANQTRNVLVDHVINGFSGVSVTPQDNLLIFSRGGEVKKFEDNGAFQSIINFKLPSSDLIVNSLTSVASNTNNVYLGDNFGSLFICELQSTGSYKVLHSFKAHSSLVNEMIAFNHDNTEFLVSISKDRMIQFFHKLSDAWDLLQTIPLHTGNLLKVQYHQGDVYVSSSDRSISIHRMETNQDGVALSLVKIISLKATPHYFEIYESELVVSTSDKNLSIYDIGNNFELKRTLKLMNEKTNESLQVENFVVDKQHIFVSSSDKSVRVFNYESGKPVGAAWGHSESILRLTKRSENELISISTDGCIFIWNIKESGLSETVYTEPHTGKLEESFSVYTKLNRKILSSSPVKSNFTRIRESESLSPSQAPSPKQAPSPRLSNATLKRIEAKQKLQDENTEQGSETPTPGTRPRSPVRSSNILSRSSSASPIRSSSFSPIRRKAQPLKLPQPLAASKRNSIGVVSNPCGINEKLSISDNNDSAKKVFDSLETIELLILSGNISEPNMAKICQKISHIHHVISREGSDTITKGFKKLNLNEQESVISDSNKDESSDEAALLQKYSDKLVQLVEKRLSEISR